MFFLTLSQIVGYLISVIIILVIVQFVISLLVAFNVVSMHNQWVAAIYNAVNAKDWLKRQVNPPRAVAWQPHQVWSSCDGTLTVTKGAWQRPDGSVGYFTTVWERQRDGEYEWVMDQGDELAEPLEAPQMIGATTALCGSQPTPPAEMLAGPSDTINSGAARDGTLRWHVVSRPDGSRSVVASYWDGSGWQDAVRADVAAE